MLLRLILLVLVVMGAYAAVRWWRAQRLVGSGGLNVIELNELLKLAKKSQRLDAALKLRVLIVDAAGAAERERVAKRVDGVVRQLAKQEQMASKIGAALGGIDTQALAARIDDARVEAETATEPEVREREREKLRSLETQSEQVDKLTARREELHSAAERIMIELNNLHLAMLDAKSSEASLENESVKHALAELEDAGDTLRRETSAEDEVNRLLKAASSRQLQ